MVFLTMRKRPLIARKSRRCGQKRITSHKPLFEQLGSNKVDEEATREEFQRSIVRGTRALDEEDCAHQDAVQREKQKQDQAVKASLDEELALFRAARADRAQTDLVFTLTVCKASTNASVSST